MTNNVKGKEHENCKGCFGCVGIDNTYGDCPCGTCLIKMMCGHMGSYQSCGEVTKFIQLGRLEFLKRNKEK